ncbi:MAG TPA: phosphatidylglycerol lysyltransferase domain-containing protein [Acidimicrobiales bacterium]|nr:phosphatidylglycerol lysyltransferase domain-containing protein [Acidimicrobiales bacterium]
MSRAPEEAAVFPPGPEWPGVADPGLRMRRVRRWAAIGIALGAVVNMISAVTPPFRSRFQALQDWLPLSVSQGADAVVALAGLSLLFLARGVRRGQRRAWLVSVVVLAVSSVLHLLKGIDFEETVVSVLVLAFLLVNGRSFAARSDRPSLRWAFSTLGFGALLVIALAVAGVEVTMALDRRTTVLPFTRAVEAVGGRLVGIHLVPLPRRLDLFLTPALTAVTFGVVTAALYLASRPVVSRHAPPADTLVRARRTVGKWGHGTLDYFALRSDKSFFFTGETVVAYGVYGGVCLVSPDPIGPDHERDEAWAAFGKFAYSHGWSLGVMGAGEDWLPTYRRAGMHDMYVGDEAVVDVTRLDLSGGRHKSLRQAVNRVAKYGYTVSFHDPRALDAAQRAAVESVMDKSRRGDVERGFSMTLGRLFDPDDRDLLLAVAWDSEGTPVAFCQYVPAPGINGYSLDLMRRDAGEHPNGLIDFLVVETARYLKERGLHRLGLNFATMRAVLAGESGDNMAQRVERWMLRRLSGSMQIESLWRFNAKFDPEWLPRYLVYDAPEHLLPIGMAVARAESFWELPLIGRFLVPSA